MSKLAQFIEELLLPIIAVTSLLVSLADLFGLFHLIPTSSIPMLTLLLVSLALNSLVLIQRRCTEIHEQAQRLLSRIALEEMAKEALEQIDPALREVLSDSYFLDIVEFLQTAIRESKVPIHDNARFRYYYNRTLQLYPKTTFFAVYSSATSYLWKDHVLQKATADFIRSGGIMEHIILMKDEHELSSPTVQEIIDLQQKIGVQTHVVSGSVIPGDLRKNFIVESRGKIVWEIHVDSDGHLVSSMVSTNKPLNASYCRIFEKLHESKIQGAIG